MLLPGVQPGGFRIEEIGKVLLFLFFLIYFFIFSLLSFAGGGARAASVSHW